MKIYPHVAQGSDAWMKLRLGRPTASEFHRVVTPKKCDLSAQAHSYALRLVAERLLNMPMTEGVASAWMERGKELEASAAQQYEFEQDVTAFPVGFITTDDGTLGCSPDRLVLGEQRRAVEIKCPAPHVHLGYLLDGTNDDYKPQVQGQILVAELERADLYSYHPQMPPALVTTVRDADYAAKLEFALKKFVASLADLFDRAQKLGAYQSIARSAAAPEAIEAAALARQFAKETTARMIAEGFTA